MDIFKIIIVGIVGTILTVLLSDYRKDFSIIVALATGIIIFLSVADLLSRGLTELFSMLSAAKVDFVYLDVALKIIGVSYLARFGADLCRDAGCSAIALKIELAAKVIIVCLSLPVIRALLTLVVEILP